MYGYKRPYTSRRGWTTYSGRPYKYSRRGTVGRAAAAAAAAKRSDKTESYSCTVNGATVFTIAPRQNLSQVLTFAPYQGGVDNTGISTDATNIVHGGAINDRGFRMKCACYDEVKLDSMRVTITSATTTQANNTSFTLCTMWDRKANPKECGYLTDAEWMANGTVPTPVEIYNNEGAIKSIITSTNIYGYRRYCKASSIIEKGGYHDATIFYNYTENESPLTTMYLDAWLRNPLSFCPALYAIIYSPIAFNNGTSTIGFSYKVEYTFTFRNPKSDLDQFVLLEAPGYVNPPMGGDDDDPDGNNRYSRGILADIQKNYLIRASKSMTPQQTEKTMSKFYKPAETEEKEEDKDVMKIEDDPGTA